MKGRTRYPLWLICDLNAAIRLTLAVWMLTYCIRRYWPRTRPPTRKGATTVAIALCCAEALMRGAIMRQVFRACGLDPRTARLFQLPLATTSFTWNARCRTLIRMAGNMSLYARRWARRLRERGDDDDFRSDDSGPAIPATIPATTIFSRVAGDESRREAHVAIRGPPRLAHAWRLPIADCLAARASEAAGVCAPRQKGPLPGLRNSTQREAYSPSWSIAVSRPSASPARIPGSA